MAVYCHECYTTMHVDACGDPSDPQSFCPYCGSHRLEASD